MNTFFCKEEVAVPDNKVGHIVLYLDENGNSWYDEQRKFYNDTIKISCDREGAVLHWSRDVTAVSPFVGGMIYEINTEIPGDFTSFKYKFSPENGFFENKIHKNQLLFAELIRDVETMIREEKNNLDYAEFGLIDSDKNKIREKIANLLSYKKKLCEMEIGDSEMDWPEKPE